MQHISTSHRTLRQWIEAERRDAAEETTGLVPLQAEVFAKNAPSESRPYLVPDFADLTRADG